MNKQRYIAELTGLLVFMIPADRAETARRYEALFDGVDEEGLQELLERIGSPTAAAVRLSREYSPGHVVDEMLPEKEDLPELGWEDERGDTAGDDAKDENAAPALHGSARFIAMPIDMDQTEPPKEEVTVERSMPLWVGVPLFILVMLVLALPVGIVVLALLPVLAAPGIAILIGAWLAFVGGLWCISFIADAIMLFGVAFIVLALGILVLWCGFRLAVWLVGGYCKAVRGAKRLMLGKKVVRHA